MAPPPDVAILCGGLGTRIRGVLGDVPKALAPVGGRPFLASLIDELTGAGVRRIVLCTGVGSEQIRAHFQDRAGVVISAEPAPLGTGGALALARPHLDSDPVLVLNGDSTVPGLDWRRVLSGPADTIVLVPRDARSDSGLVRVDASARVQAFAEKAELKGEAFQSAGIYLLSQALLAMIPAGPPCSLEREMMPRWIASGLNGHIHRGRLVDIGTRERLARAQAEAQA